MGWFSDIWGKMMKALDKEIETLDLSGQVTKNFSVNEFRCKDADKTPYPKHWIKTKLKPLCMQLEVIREACGNKPITITSGYRTPEYNKAVGGARLSKHKEGIAADFQVSGMEPAEVGQIIVRLMNEGKIMKGGLGVYPRSWGGWCHFDIRGFKVVWKG